MTGRAAEQVAVLAQRDVALAGPVTRRGPRPQDRADRVSGSAVGALDGEEGQQLAGFVGAGADLAVPGGDPQRAEHVDPYRSAPLCGTLHPGFSRASRRTSALMLRRVAGRSVLPRMNL